MKKQKIHFVHPYLLNPLHPISISVIGCGGTGSNVLANLIPLHLSLKALGHAGIYVYAFDDDIVSEANTSRQLFYPSDIGLNKAEVLISRINRSYGLDWMAIPVKYQKNGYSEITGANITISCVDSMKSRKSIHQMIYKDIQKINLNTREDQQQLYWIDTGNGKDYGQVIIGTITESKQKSKEYHVVSKLPNAIDEFKGVRDKKGYDEPSCSVMESLGKQGCYTNKSIALYTTELLWHMFRKGRIFNRGVYVHLGRLQVNPIKL